MTPEQIEELRFQLEGEWPEPWDEVQPLIRALLAEWEERGREIERLKRAYDHCNNDRQDALNRAEQAEAKLAEALTLLRRVEIEGSEEITTAHAARRDAEARLAKVEEWARTAHAWGYTKPEGYSQGYADAQAFVRDALAAALAATQPKEEP